MASTKDQCLAELTRLFDLLSDETRMHMVCLLAKGDCSVGSLIKILKRPQPNMSHHLGLLRMNGIVVANRKGKQVIYSLAENIRISGGKLRVSLPSATVTVDGF
jgi:DNA-binding transcriptional ArsR family regulator